MVLRLISGSAGVYQTEDDESGYINGVVTSVGAIVFPSKQGSLTVQDHTNATTFTSMYGLSDTSWGLGHLSAKTFLKQGRLKALRIPGQHAKYAGSSLTYTSSIPNGNNISVSPYYSTGTNNAFDTDGVELYNTIISQALINGSSISGSISSENISLNITPVGFSGDNASTYATLTSSINSTLASLNSLLIAQSAVQTYMAPPSAKLLDADYGIIQIAAPESAPLSFNFVVDNNGSATTFEAYSSNLIDIFAENPGDWANDIGWNITNIDTGINQRANLTFSSTLIPGNIITLNLIINNSLVPISYTVTSNQTSDQALANITALINQAFGNGLSTNATVTYPGAFGAGYGRIINLVSPIAGPKTIGLNSFTVTGGSSQPIILFNETLAGVASNATFNFNVYKRGNIRYPVETFTCSLTPQLNGYQDQLFMEEAINTSGNKSAYVRVAVNKALVASGLFIDPKYASQFSNITYLSGGDNGALPTTSDLINGWNTFLDSEKYKISILINAGFTDPSIQQNLVNIAITRRDCMAIIDVPASSQSVTDCYNWRTQESNINSSFASIGSSDGLVTDTDTNQKVYCPRSALDAARWAYTDKNFASWFAPAGYDRGYLPDVLQFRVDYDKPSRDILDAVQINCGKQSYDGSGRLIFGENTSQVTPSLLSSIAVRRCLIYIENSIAYSVDRYLFEQNSEKLGFLIRKRIEAFLQPIKDAEGLKNFYVLIGASNNPGVFADAGQLNISVFMVPIRPVKTILLQSVILPLSITFTESVINGSL